MPDAAATDNAVARAMSALDDVIHQKARLGIMATLLALGEADFRLLRETLSLSDGNLSTHLALLEERGYVTLRKEFRGRRLYTSARPTDAGRAAFRDYLGALEGIIMAARPAGSLEPAARSPGAERRIGNPLADRPRTSR